MRSKVWWRSRQNRFRMAQQAQPRNRRLTVAELVIVHRARQLNAQRVSIGVDLRLHANSISSQAMLHVRPNRTYYCWIYLYCSCRTLKLTSTVELAPLVKTPRYRIVLLGVEL